MNKGLIHRQGPRLFVFSFENCFGQQKTEMKRYGTIKTYYLILIIIICSVLLLCKVSRSNPDCNQVHKLGVKDQSEEILLTNNQFFHRSAILIQGVQNPPVSLSNPDDNCTMYHLTQRLQYDVKTCGQYLLEDWAYFYTAPARLDKKSILITASILAAGGAIYAFDQEIYDAVQRTKDHAFMQPFVKAGNYLEPLGMQAHTNKYVFSAFALSYLLDYKPILYPATDVIEAYLIAGLAKNAIVLLIGRMRPREGYGPYHYQFGKGTSLPSGHASNMFQLATVTSHHVNWLPFTVAAYSVAGLVSLQRIEDGAHWPSDVYFGAMFGYLITREMLNRNDKRRLEIAPVSYQGGGSGLNLTFYGVLP